MRVQGLGFRVQVFGCQVPGLGFSVYGLGFRVSGFYRPTSNVEDSGLTASSSRCLRGTSRAWRQNVDK